MSIPIRLRIELLLLVLCFLGFIYWYVYRKKISVRYSVVWFISAFIMLLCAIFPGPLEIITNWLGIEKISNFLFLGGFLILFIIAFSLTIIVSDLKQKVTILTQEFGILRQEIERKEKNEK